MSVSLHTARYWDLVVERLINERREFGRDHIFLGDHYHHKFPLLAPCSMFERHGLIVGPPGSGKSVLAAQFATQFLAYGYNVLVIDCKGSFALLNNLLGELATTGDSPSHDIRVFNPFRGFPSHIYNPLRQKHGLMRPPILVPKSGTMHLASEAQKERILHILLR